MSRAFSGLVLNAYRIWVMTTTKSRHLRAPAAKAQKLPLLRIPTRVLDEEWTSSGVGIQISKKAA
jgi:hypothetical protein